MTLRVSLICAASTEALCRGAFPQDEAAEAKALVKATALASYLRYSDRVLASPALRARQTVEALGFSAAIDPLLAECDYGHWSGQILAEIHLKDPEGVAAWIMDPESAPHGGESILDLIKRAADWLDARQRDSGHLIAVSHPAFIRSAILNTIGAPASSFWRLDIEPLSVTDLRMANDRWTLRSSGMPLGYAAGNKRPSQSSEDL